MSTIANFKKDYKERIVPALVKEFSYKSVMQAPKLTKIVINQGLGIAVADKKIIETAINNISSIKFKTLSFSFIMFQPHFHVWYNAI